MSEDVLIEKLIEYIEIESKRKKWDFLELAHYLEQQFRMDTILNKIVGILEKSSLNPEEEGIFYYLMNISNGQIVNKSLIGLSTIHYQIYSENKLYFYKRNFELYNLNQNLFKKFPELFSYLRQKENGRKDYELIKVSKLNYLTNLSLPYVDNFRYKDSYIFINSYLNCEILNFLANKYGENDIYVRLDPYKILDEKPLVTLKEEFLRPPNPKWIKKLLLFPGEKEGCDLFLPDHKSQIYYNSEGKHNKQQIEYDCYKIRKLEIISTMKQEQHFNHFSMSLEELSEEDLDHGRLIGRMIHLDTLNSFKTPFEKIKLKHLDLAINVYEKEKISERNSISLSNGKKVTSASYRVHLLRADNIMMIELIDIARMFFKSTSMVEEWIEKQFEFIDSK